MGKVLVRTTIVLTAFYFIISHILAIHGIDIMTKWYVLLFELCVVLYCYGEGKYHCKYIKYTAMAIFISDALTTLDNYFDFFSVYWHNILPFLIIFYGLSYSLTMAITHFVKVLKVKIKKPRI